LLVIKHLLKKIEERTLFATSIEVQYTPIAQQFKKCAGCQKRHKAHAGDLKKEKK